MIDSKIPQPLQERINRELDKDERVLWSAMPKPIYFTSQATILVVVGTAFTLMAAYFILSMTEYEIPDFRNIQDFIALLGVPFLAVAIALILAPVWAHGRALKTVYVITDRRILLLKWEFGPRVHSLSFNKLANVYRREYRDGTSDLVIDELFRRPYDGKLTSIEHVMARISSAKQAQMIIDGQSRIAKLEVRANS